MTRSLHYTPFLPEVMADPVPRSSGVGVVLVVVVLLVIAGAAGAYFLMGRPTASPTANTVIAKVPTPTAQPSPSNEPTASAAPSASAAPIASAAPSASAKGYVDDGDDGSKLNWSQGYLVVKSSADADVYATGFKIGSTNAKNLSNCGMKYVRIGSGKNVRWISEGQTVDVKCRAVTVIEIQPTK